MEIKQVAEERAYLEGGYMDGRERGVYPPGRDQIEISVTSEIDDGRVLIYLRTDRRRTIGDVDVPVYQLRESA